MDHEAIKRTPKLPSTVRVWQFVHCANEMGGLANAIIIVEQRERKKLKLNNLNSITLHPRPSPFARSVGELE